MWTDLRFAIRGLTKTPGFSIVAIVVLALAVAVNAAIFSWVNAVFIRPLPVQRPGELAFVFLVDPQTPNLTTGVSFRTFEALKARTDVFADGAHRTGDSARLVIDGIERRQTGEMVTGNYFQMLGVPALLGRTLMPADDEGDAAPAMVISEALWRGEFHADPNVIGRVVPLISDSRYMSYYSTQASSYTIVGVAAAPFSGVGDVWAPAAFWTPSVKRIEDLHDPIDDIEWSYLKMRYGRPILRRRDGVTLAQAAAVVADVGRAHLREEAPRNPTYQLVAEGTHRVSLPFQTGRVSVLPERFAAALMSVAGLVLLIAVANLIGLFTARGIAQRGEMAIRLALGATRARLARHFLAQGVAIAIASGALGMAGAIELIHLFSSTAPTQVGNGTFFRPADFRMPIDWRVWAFGAMLPIAAALVIAISRTRQANRTDVRGALQAGAQTTAAASRLRLRYLVVVPQIAAALGILLLAGLFIRALLVSEMAPQGYDARAVSFIDFDLPLMPRGEWKAARDERMALERKLREFAATIGGVTSVAVADNMGFRILQPMLTWVVAQDDSKPQSRGGLQWVGSVTASPGYLTTMGLHLLRGRDLGPLDEVSSPVALVSANLAAALWPGQDPIGRRFSRTSPGSTYPPSWIEVVGVVNDVRPPEAESNWNPMFYAPPDKFSMSGTLIVRGPGRTDDVVREVVASLKAAEPRARVTRARALESAIGDVRYPRRLVTAVLVSTGGAGLLLAAMGLFGVVSYSVAQRRREMGVRLALGAGRRDIISLVIREGMTAAAVGSGAGLLLGYWAVRLANWFALPIPAANWLAVAAVPAILAVVVYVACLIPARRAAGVDPIIVLRDL